MIIAPFEIVKVPHQSFKSRLDTRVNVFQFTGAGFHCWAFAGEGMQFLLLRVNSPLLRHSLVPLAASKTHFGVFFFFSATVNLGDSMTHLLGGNPPPLPVQGSCPAWVQRVPILGLLRVCLGQPSASGFAVTPRRIHLTVGQRLLTYLPPQLVKEAFGPKNFGEQNCQPDKKKTNLISKSARRYFVTS